MGLLFFSHVCILLVSLWKVFRKFFNHPDKIKFTLTFTIQLNHKHKSRLSLHLASISTFKLQNVKKNSLKTKYPHLYIMHRDSLKSECNEIVVEKCRALIMGLHLGMNVKLLLVWKIAFYVCVWPWRKRKKSMIKKNFMNFRTWVCPFHLMPHQTNQEIKTKDNLCKHPNIREILIHSNDLNFLVLFAQSFP